MNIITFNHAGDEAFAQNRELAANRPCGCGCDNRDDPDLIGYLHAVTDGEGFTISFHDEEEFELVARVLS